MPSIALQLPFFFLLSPFTVRNRNRRRVSTEVSGTVRKHTQIIIKKYRLPGTYPGTWSLPDPPIPVTKKFQLLFLIFSDVWLWTRLSTFSTAVRDQTFNKVRLISHLIVNLSHFLPVCRFRQYRRSKTILRVNPWNPRLNYPWILQSIYWNFQLNITGLIKLFVEDEY